jgi:hypothetical protein
VSLAKQVTVVVPMGKVEPDGGLQVTGREPSTRSLAEAANVTTLPVGPVASAVMFAGSVSTAGVVSCTLLEKLALPVLPRLSVDEQVTVVVPMGKVEPDGGLQVTGREPSTKSLAEAANVTTLPVGPVASAVMFAGSVSTGGVVSCT